MATLVLTDAFVSINAVDLSDHVASVRLNYSAEMQDASAMGTAAKKRKAGLCDWSAEVEFYQDEAAASVGVTLFPLVGAAAVAVLIRPVKGTAVGATNPNYSGNALVESFPPIGGSVGEMSKATVSLQGDGVLTRATS